MSSNGTRNGTSLGFGVGNGRGSSGSNSGRGGLVSNSERASMGKELAKASIQITDQTVASLVSLLSAFQVFKQKVGTVGDLYTNSTDINEIMNKMASILTKLLENETQFAGNPAMEVLRDSLVAMMSSQMSLVMKVYEMEAKLNSLLMYMPELQKVWLNPKLSGMGASGSMGSMGTSGSMGASGMGMGSRPSSYGGLGSSGYGSSGYSSSGYGSSGMYGRPSGYGMGARPSSYGGLGSSGLMMKPSGNGNKPVVRNANSNAMKKRAANMEKRRQNAKNASSVSNATVAKLAKNSATKIQSVVRGHKNRKAVANIKAKESTTQNKKENNNKNKNKNKKENKNSNNNNNVKNTPEVREILNARKTKYPPNKQNTFSQKSKPLLNPPPTSENNRNRGKKRAQVLNSKKNK